MNDMLSGSGKYRGDSEEKKVVIADDSPTFRMYVGLLLKRMNYKVMTAGNGVELLKLLKNEEVMPDLVLLDIEMPQMDGIKVLRHIGEDNQLPKIPVVMLTSDGQGQTIEKCKSLGCYDYLTKPIQIDKLHDVLEKCFFSHTGSSREHLRVPYIRKLPVTYKGKSCVLYTETLSADGVYLRTQEPFPAGSEITLTLPLEGGELMDLKGEVIYSKKLYSEFLNLPPGMGVQFKGLSVDDVHILKSFVKDLIARDILEGQEERVLEK